MVLVFILALCFCLLLLQFYWEYRIHMAPSLSSLLYGPDFSWLYLALAVLVIVFVVLLFVFLLKRRFLSDQEKAVSSILLGLDSGSVVVSDGPYAGLEAELLKRVHRYELLASDWEKSQSVYVTSLERIAHQLKTPLSALSLSLQNAHVDPALYAASVSAMEKQIASLLLTSRLDAGALSYEEKPVDVYTLLQIATDMLEPMAREKNVSIDLADGTASFCGDMEWSLEAVMNLLKNCVEHSPAGGTVFLSFEENELYTGIVIRDEGPGFSKAELPHLFTRYYQNDNALKNSTGLGLSIAKDLIEKQNGTLTALPGPGGCFIIHFYPRH